MCHAVEAAYDSFRTKLKPKQKPANGLPTWRRQERRVVLFTPPNQVFFELFCEGKVRLAAQSKQLA